jgi:hypothetical protein
MSADLLENLVDLLRREFSETPPKLRQVSVDPALQLLRLHHFSFFSSKGAMSTPIEARKPEA